MKEGRKEGRYQGIRTNEEEWRMGGEGRSKKAEERRMKGKRRRPKEEGRTKEDEGRGREDQGARKKKGPTWKGEGKKKGRSREGREK